MIIIYIYTVYVCVLSFRVNLWDITNHIDLFNKHLGHDPTRKNSLAPSPLGVPGPSEFQRHRKTKAGGDVFAPAKRSSGNDQIRPSSVESVRDFSGGSRYIVTWGSGRSWKIPEVTKCTTFNNYYMSKAIMNHPYGLMVCIPPIKW